MKFINSSAEIIGSNHPLTHIERIGRVCYKSNSELTLETAKKFFKVLNNNKHHSVFEHATFIFLMTDCSHHITGLRNCNKFLNFTCSSYEENGVSKFRTIVSGNLRAIKESNLSSLKLALVRAYPYDEFKEYLEVNEDDSDNINEWCNSNFICISREEFFNLKPTQEEIKKHYYTTIRFITDRGVSHEIVRHRVASYSQESTRYCNYTKDKFGGELEFITPAEFDKWDNISKATYIKALADAETNYFNLVNQGLTPQCARGVLPTDVRTIVVMTANHEEWEHFFNLRSRGTTGKPHPNMKVLADEALEKYNSLFNSLLNLHLIF